jgi:hypothetical protein
MADLTVKRGDLKPVVNATLTDESGTAIDLTGATVTFTLRKLGSVGTPLLNAVAATVVSAASGTVRYTWLATNTDTAGLYLSEWRVTFSDATTQRFPTVGYNTVQIVDHLGTGYTAGDLITGADAKAHMGNITISDYDTRLQSFISAASAYVNERCAAEFAAVTYTESHSGGKERIILKHYPVASVTSVNEYTPGSGTPTTVAVSTNAAPVDGYLLDADRGYLIRTASGSPKAWVAGVSNIDVIYVAAKSSVPEDLRLAVKELVRYWWQISQGGLPASAGYVDDGGVSPWGVPDMVRRLLQPYGRGPSVG